VIFSAAMTKRKPAAVDEDMTTASLLEYFAKVPDPRVDRSQLHPLSSVLVLALCAVICGANSFVGIEYFGNAREAWLRTFLDLPNGIPSHDTLGRIFAMLDPAALEQVFREWVAALVTLTKGEVVAIDGKTLRRSFQKAGSGAFVHMVSAWAAGHQMVLGQIKTEEKSNEITAIPRLLELLQIHGCLVTIDAMGCQKEIAQKIVDSKADYLLAVKDNQPTLAAAVTAVFEEALSDRDFSEAHHQTENRGHGRTEVRRCWTLNIDAECGTPFDQWPMLKGIVRVEAERTVAGKTSLEHRYYITSRNKLSAKSALAASRSHWGIENQLHWVLDVGFREDDCRVRAGNAAENFAVLRHIAVNLLKTVQGGLKKNGKLGVYNKRLLAAWDDSYLLRILGVPS
jgi:predicted transposase YbfD/YdcC